MSSGKERTERSRATTEIQNCFTNYRLNHLRNKLGKCVLTREQMRDRFINQRNLCQPIDAACELGHDFAYWLSVLISTDWLALLLTPFQAGKCQLDIAIG